MKKKYKTKFRDKNGKMIRTTDNIITKCPSCGGELKKTKYGKTCEDCLTDF